MQALKSKISLCSIVFIFSAFTSYAQTIDQKINTILNNTGQVSQWKEFILAEYLNPIKASSEIENSDALKAVEAKVTEVQIAKRLATVFKANFTTKEISDIYQFSVSESGKKFLQAQSKLAYLYEDSFEDLIAEIKRLKVPYDNVKPASPIYNANRPDGIYKVTNYTSNSYDISKFILEDKPSIDISDILTVSSAVLEEPFSRVVINLELTPEGALKFKKLTEENISKPLAIVIDKMILSAPIIQGAIPGGKVQISGNLTMEESDRLVKKLKNQLIQR